MYISLQEAVSAPVLKGRFSPGNPGILCGKPEVYPDFKGGWQPHYVFVGEIIDVRKNKKIMLNNETFMKLPFFI